MLSQIILEYVRGFAAVSGEIFYLKKFSFRFSMGLSWVDSGEGEMIGTDLETETHLVLVSTFVLTLCFENL